MLEDQRRREQQDRRRDRSGDVDTLREIGRELGFAVDVVPPVGHEDQPPPVEERPDGCHEAVVELAQVGPRRLVDQRRKILTWGHRITIPLRNGSGANPT